MILEADNIELGFGERKILYSIYLKAETGKVTGIIGRNGSGKTCLLRIIFGSQNAKYKNIRKDGVHQKAVLFKANIIAYLPQHQLLPTTIKLKQAFALFDADWFKFESLFKSFEKYEKSRTHELSSGELRVVEAYLVLSSNKEIILLDEPFSFIAPLYVEKIKALINEKKKDSIIIITDHFYQDIIDVSDSIYLLKNGHSSLIRSISDLENEGYINHTIKPE